MDNKRLTNADLAEIKKRVEKVAKGNLLVSLSALQTNNKVIFEDVPALLAEVDRLTVILISEEMRLATAERLLSEAHDILDDVHCSETEVYREISHYFNGEGDPDA